MILPIFNVEDCLDIAMESLIKQDFGFENIEVILVDDCSTDNTRSIINKYTNKYENCKSIFLETNSGNAGHPRNIGIKNSTTNYLMFMDPDDEYASDACKTFYDVISEKKIDFVHSNWTSDNYGKLKLTEHPFIKTNTYFEFKNNENIENYHKYFRPGMCAAIYDKNFVLKNNIFCSNELGEDLYFALLAIFKSRKVIFLADYYGYFNKMRDTDENISITNIRDEKKFMSRLNSLYTLLDLLKQEPIKNNYYVLNMELKILLDQFYSLDHKISLETRKKLLKKVWEFEKPIKQIIKLDKKHSFLNYFIIKNHFKSGIMLSKIMGYLFNNKHIRKLVRFVYR